MTAQHWGAPIISRHVADDIVDRLVTAVALGLYVPAQQLPTERDLATMLGVSRSSVREALKQLTDSGYLQVRRGRNGGYFVLADWGPTSAERVRRHLVANWAEFEQIFDARTLIGEFWAAGLRQLLKHGCRIDLEGTAYAGCQGSYKNGIGQQVKSI